MKPIRTEADHQAALNRVAEIWEAPENTPEFDELEILVTLIEKYETEHYPLFEDTDPIEVIKYTIQEKGMKNKDLMAWLGSESTVSNILAKRRQLTIEMVRKLHQHLGIPLQLLVN